MPAIPLTRRQFLAATTLAALVETRKTWTLENDAIGFRLAIAKGAVVEKTFAHRLTGQSLSLPREEFQLAFDDGRTVSSTHLQVGPGNANDRAAEFHFSDDAGLEVRVRYSLARDARYLRKEIFLRQARGQRRKLLRVDLENWQGVARRWDSMHGDRLNFGSHPIFCDDVWAGVEFVAAFNDYGPAGFTLRSRPGGMPVDATWRGLRSTVTGVAARGRVREAFLDYLEDIRLAPARMVACYNSWWTLPKVVTQPDNLALIQQLKAAMFDRHGVFFDIITTDMGWSNPRSIWEIDRSILPRGFDDIRAIVEPAGGKLGLWMSPSECYPPVCDYEWAEKNGYVVLQPDASVPPELRIGFQKPGLSLADPKYREQTKAQLRKLIRENGLAHIKYDGFWAIEHRAHHDLLPGVDSVEPLAAHSLELMQASKAASPTLVTEPTYMNSTVGYISPWILKYSDTVWANGEDCVVGLGPAPDFRESHTNARECMVFQSLDHVWLPQNAVHYFDIVHVDSREGFANHAAMAFGRGRFFLSTYVNPKLMNADDWRLYAGFLRWARENTELLRHTVVVPSRVELGEPYCYAHWQGTRGIVVVRNPSNETREFVLELMRAGAPAELADGVCYAQYPGRKGIAAGLHARSAVALTLAPWELVFLEIVPRAQLRELVAIGARWYRESDGAPSFVPDHGVAQVRLLTPGAADRMVAVAPESRTAIAGKIGFRSVQALAQPDAFAAKPRATSPFTFHYPAEFDAGTRQALREAALKDVKWKRVAGVRFELECEVSLPAGSGSGQVLLLVEFPGREHRPSRCTASVDGVTVTLEQRDSAEHIGYYNWTGALRPFESEWTWYLCPVGRGQCRVKFTGEAGHPNPRLGVWAWTEDDLSARTQRIAGLRCGEPALPPHRDRIERRGVCLLRPV